MKLKKEDGQEEEEEDQIRKFLRHSKGNLIDIPNNWWRTMPSALQSCLSFFRILYLPRNSKAVGGCREAENRSESDETRHQVFLLFATSISLLTNRMSRDDLFSFSTVEHDAFAFEIVSLPIHFTFKPITNSQTVRHPPPHPFPLLSPPSPYV